MLIAKYSSYIFECSIYSQKFSPISFYAHLKQSEKKWCKSSLKPKVGSELYRQKSGVSDSLSNVFRDQFKTLAQLWFLKRPYFWQTAHCESLITSNVRCFTDKSVFICCWERRPATSGRRTLIPIKIVPSLKQQTNVENQFWYIIDKYNSFILGFEQFSYHSH